MKWRNLYLSAGLAAVMTIPAFASEVAPDAVEFTDAGIAASVTGIPGNPESGAAAFKDRRLGNCLACHANSAMSNELFHGDVGPSLDGVAERYDEATLRAIIVNSKKVFGDQTVMPGFYSLEQGVGVAKDRAGTTILTAQQVEDVVAYLATLKE